MFLRSTILRVFAVATVVAVLALASFADTLHLKDGSIIKGKIVAFTGGKFTIVMGDGARRHELTFLASEVDSIKFDDESNVAAAEPNQPSRKYEPAQLPPDKRSKPTVVVTDNTAAGQPEQKPRFKDWSVDQKPTVIQSAPRTQPQVIPVNGTGSQPGRVDPPRPTPNTAGQPIAWDIKVTADNRNNGWTNTGWVVKKGQRIRITGDGTVNLGKGKTSTPSGDPDIADTQKLLKNVATGALIAVIGDDNNEFIYVGAERTFTATRDGALFLGINEGYLDDNTGTYSIKVEIIPDDSK